MWRRAVGVSATVVANLATDPSGAGAGTFWLDALGSLDSRMRDEAFTFEARILPVCCGPGFFKIAFFNRLLFLSVLSPHFRTAFGDEMPH